MYFRVPDKICKFVLKIDSTMGQPINIADIKNQYPNEWVLIGNPIMDDNKINVLSGIPLFHSKDKKEVCYIGRNKTQNFYKITLIYTGSFKSVRKITGIFNQLRNDPKVQTIFFSKSINFKNDNNIIPNTVPQ